jgi:hypothetical protein
MGPRTRRYERRHQPANHNGETGCSIYVPISSTYLTHAPHRRALSHLVKPQRSFPSMRRQSRVGRVGDDRRRKCFKARGHCCRVWFPPPKAQSQKASVTYDAVAGSVRKVRGPSLRFRRVKLLAQSPGVPVPSIWAKFGPVNDKARSDRIQRQVAGVRSMDSSGRGTVLKPTLFR